MGAQWKQKFRLESGARKGALFSRLAKEIIMAAKNGIPDPDSNARLRAALENARKNSMPRDTIERALKKGRGEIDAHVVYETVTYEGYCPHQVPIIVECLTENRNRTASEVRVLFRKGQIGTSVTWLFDRRGVIEASHPQGADPEEAAIEADAQDVRPGEDSTEFLCEPTDLDAVSRALQARGWLVSRSALGWVPKSLVELDADAQAEVAAFLQGFEENEDVQEVYVGVA